MIATRGNGISGVDHKDGFGEIVDIEVSLVKEISQAHLVCIKYVVLTDRISKGALLPLSSLLLF